VNRQGRWRRHAGRAASDPSVDARVAKPAVESQLPVGQCLHEIDQRLLFSRIEADTLRRIALFQPVVESGTVPDAAAVEIDDFAQGRRQRAISASAKGNFSNGPGRASSPRERTAVAQRP